MDALRPIYRRFLVPLLLAGLGICLAQQSVAQSLVSVASFSSKDGLSHRWVFDVKQDRRGFIWISTFDGLNRYDGHEFRVFRPSAQGKLSQNANRIRWTKELADGRFLVSTEVGMFEFDPYTESFRRLTHQPFNRDLFWLATADHPQGEWLQEGTALHAGSQHMLSFLAFSGDSLRATARLSYLTLENCRLVRSTGQWLWFYADTGVYYRLDLHSRQWRAFPVTDLADPTIPVDRQGRCWYVGHDDHQPRSFQLPPSIATLDWQGCVFDGDDIWLIARHPLSGIYRFNGRSEQLEEIIRDADRENDAGAIEFGADNLFRDKHGALWLCGSQGVLKLHRRRKLFTRYLAKDFPTGAIPPVDFSARGMAEAADGGIFIVHNDGRLFYFHPDTGQAKPIRPVITYAATAESTTLVSGFNYVMSEAGGHTLWFAHADGLLRYDPPTNTGILFPTPSDKHMDFSTVWRDHRGRLWVEGGNQLFSFDTGTGRFHPLPGISTPRKPIGIDPDSAILWLPTDHGLQKLYLDRAETEEITLYTEGAEQRWLLKQGGYYWIGTSRGLVRLHPRTYETRTYTREQGLPGNFVYSLIADGDYLWLGTSDGLCRFDIRTEEVKNFFVGDGLSHDEFNSYSTLKARDGRLYMGTLNGVNAFYPDELAGKKLGQPHLLWSGFSYLDTRLDSLFRLPYGKLDTGRALRLPPSVRSFTIRLALDSYLAPEEHKYAWRIDDLDEGWNYMGNQPFAVYNYLPPGRYRFRAKAADQFGNWSEELVVSLWLVRPWYGRWWAWTLYALAAAGLLYLLYRIRLQRRLDRAEAQRVRELNEVKSRLYTNITHEFRTPLTVILGLVEQLKQGRNGQEESILNTVLRNGKNLLSLINQLLDLAKLEAGAMPLHMVQGDVVSYSRYIMGSFHSYAQSRGIDLAFAAEMETFLMDYDPEKWMHIQSNLLANALKFTKRGGRVRLRLATTPTDGETPGRQLLKHHPSLSPSTDQAWLYLSVQDTGVGIEADKLPYIFDRFYQADDSATRRGEGTGIGLSLVRELVKLMRGEIWAESTPGHGTTITIRLPVIRSQPLRHVIAPREEGVNLAAVDAPTKDADVSAQDDRPLLLIVEDNVDVIQYLRACLEEDYQLAIAYNGQQGIDKAVELIPDIIVSDVMMPEKDGYELCQTLKNDERTSHIPIILLTAKADAASRIAGLERGADAYLAKPFDRKELLVRLRKLIDLRRTLQAYFAKADTAPAPPSAKLDVQIEDQFLKKVRAAVEAHLADAEFNTDQLCLHLHMSYTQLYRKIKALTDQSIAVYIRTIRLQKARELLQTTDLTVSEIAYDVGFTNLSYFSRTFAEQYGKPPKEVRSEE